MPQAFHREGRDHFRRRRRSARLWLQAIHLVCSSKKGISANQLHRILGVTLKTAWFMGHRIREAMRDGSLAPMGGSGSIVEVDETVFGKQEGAPKNASFKGSNFRNIALTLVERGGSARSFHVDSASIADLQPIICANVAPRAAIMTDEWPFYRSIGKDSPAMTPSTTLGRICPPRG